MTTNRIPNSTTLAAIEAVGRGEVITYDTPQKAMQAMLQELQAYDKKAIQAYKDYQESGLHITLDEFVDWVDSLEVGTSKDIPQCHK